MAIDGVQTAWETSSSLTGYLDDADLDAILTQMRTMAARASPADAEGDLYRILDLLAHAKTRASVATSATCETTSSPHCRARPAEPGAGTLCPFAGRPEGRRDRPGHDHRGAASRGLANPRRLLPGSGAVRARAGQPRRGRVGPRRIDPGPRRRRSPGPRDLCRVPSRDGDEGRERRGGVDRESQTRSERPSPLTGLRALPVVATDTQDGFDSPAARGAR